MASARDNVAVGVIPWLLLGFGAVGLFSAGCAAQRLRVEASSLAEHRAAAERERAEANAHRELFDPYALVTRIPLVPAEPGLPVMDDTDGSNPTSWHLAEAADHEAHARAHAAAAIALERFEATECRAIPAKERGACPIIVAALGVHEIDGGVRVDLRTEADAARIAARMRCHLAYAHAVGFDRAPSCPLYMRGVDIRLSAGGRAIDVVGDRRAVVLEIRRHITEVALIAR